MGVAQVDFIVPDWVELGLNDGSFKLFGGIVRNLRGEIVYHLKNAKVISDKVNSKGKLVVVAGSLIGAAGYIVYKLLSKKEKIADKLEEFNISLVRYLRYAHDSKMSIDVILELQDKCNKLISLLNKYDISEIQISQSEEKTFSDVINSIKNYTSDLNKANEIHEIIEEKNSQQTIKNNLIELNKYLNIQKQIFENYKVS